MSAAKQSRLRRGLRHAAHSGFPWAMAGGKDGHSLQLRRAIRRSVVEIWPAGFRLPGRLLMALMWPIESLRDAAMMSFQLDRGVLGGRSRVLVALRAWAAALGYNLPPVDYLTYRLFEPDRPGPGCWLHSADAHLHFSAIAAPEVRSLAGDKLAFADLGCAIGADVMPVLAAYGAEGPIRPFAGGKPPPQDLLVKPRWGHGGRGHLIWRWDGGRHVAIDPVPEAGLVDWLSNAAQSGDLLIQALAKPPCRLGQIAPVVAPVLSIITIEWPDGRREAVFALLALELNAGGSDACYVRQIDLDTGRMLATLPGDVAPAFGQEPDSHDFGDLSVPGWQDILAEVDKFHMALPGHAPVLKWDFVLTDLGPRLLETNTGTGVYPLQSMTLRPITETPLGAALEAWAR